MSKVFLSHSSVDKPFVRYIAEQLGKDRCVYDEMCFESGMKNIDEIFKGINETSIFVIFISNTSLNSDWVKKELFIAEERLNHDNSKLSQLYPIIIDERINHRDSRIPDFLKNGFDSYNLRVIKRKEVAYRKIRAQLTNRLLTKDQAFHNNYEIFYGRDASITQFKTAFDSGLPIKCIVASGIDGIGRRTYIKEALKNAKIIERYYDPVTIQMDELDGIDDLIIRLYEAGFGSYSLDNISNLASVNAKIDALASCFNEIQEYREHVIIYDNGSLVRNSEIKYWFMKALDQIRPEITVSIAASHNISYMFKRKNKEVFHTTLSSMSFPEWNGLLRVYSKAINIEFSPEDREYFKDIITGYPPQVIYCANLARDNDSIEYVKNNSYKIVEFASESVLKILRNALPEEKSDAGYGFLSFISAYGSVPSDIVEEIFKLNPEYESIFRILRSTTICRRVGIGGEYITINSLVGDYIQRNKVSLPQDISSLLQSKLQEFNENINNPSFLESEDFESIRYYLKENLKTGQVIPEKYMYSTLYLKAIYELYNSQKYPQVIEMVKNLKDIGAFNRYDIPVQDRIQGYYCRALARQGDNNFYEEVEHFSRGKTSPNPISDYIEYNFLRGFMFRHNGAYDKALDRYKNVLSKRPKHTGAMREIVAVYKGLEDYDSAFQMAYSNYRREPENPYQIQPYFEALLRHTSRTEKETKDLTEMKQTLSFLNDRKPLNIYYELMAQYSMYIENDEEKTRAFLTLGEEKFKDSSFMARTAFNCYEHFHDIDNMKKALHILEQESINNKSVVPAYNVRKVILDAYEKIPERSIIESIDSLNGITSDAKERLKKRVKSICSHRE